MYLKLEKLIYKAGEHLPLFILNAGITLIGVVFQLLYLLRELSTKKINLTGSFIIIASVISLIGAMGLMDSTNQVYWYLIYSGAGIATMTIVITLLPLAINLLKLVPVAFSYLGSYLSPNRK